LSGADCVKESGDNYAQPVLLLESQTQEFIYRLTAGIRPPGQRCAAEHNVIVFAEGDGFIFTVNFAAGSNQNFSAKLIGCFEHLFGAADIGLDCMNGAVGNQLNADCRSKVENYVDSLCQSFHQWSIADIPFNELKGGIGVQAFDIFQAAGAEVIDNDYFVTILDQPLC
jgi:hypothetical protein